MRKNICIVTVSPSGLGLETVRLLGRSQSLLLVGEDVSLLRSTQRELSQAGIAAETFPCDLCDRSAVWRMAEHAAALGDVRMVLHTVGLTPEEAGADKLFAVNTLSAINMNEVFAQVLGEGGMILNMAAASAHTLPKEREPHWVYRLALQNSEDFLRAADELLDTVPRAQRSELAYVLSENFVLWYTARLAEELRGRVVRALTVTPGEALCAAQDVPMKRRRRRRNSVSALQTARKAG